MGGFQAEVSSLLWRGHQAFPVALALLRAVPEQMKNSFWFVKDAVNAHGRALKYETTALLALHANLRASACYRLHSARNYLPFKLVLLIYDCSLSFRYATQRLRERGEFVLAAIDPDKGKFPKALTYAAPPLLNDRNFIQLALSRNPACFKYLPLKYKGEK